MQSAPSSPKRKLEQLEAPACAKKRKLEVELSYSPGSPSYAPDEPEPVPQSARYDPTASHKTKAQALAKKLQAKKLPFKAEDYLKWIENNPEPDGPAFEAWAVAQEAYLATTDVGDEDFAAEKVYFFLVQEAKRYILAHAPPSLKDFGDMPRIEESQEPSAVAWKKWAANIKLAPIKDVCFGLEELEQLIHEVLPEWDVSSDEEDEDDEEVQEFTVAAFAQWLVDNPKSATPEWEAMKEEFLRATFRMSCRRAQAKLDAAEKEFSAGETELHKCDGCMLTTRVCKAPTWSVTSKYCFLCILQCKECDRARPAGELDAQSGMCLSCKVGGVCASCGDRDSGTCRLLEGEPRCVECRQTCDYCKEETGKNIPLDESGNRACDDCLDEFSKLA